MCLRTVISSVCDTYSNPPEESWTDARCAHSMLGRPRTPPTQDQEQADGCVCRREAEEGESPHPRNHSGMRKDKRNGRNHRVECSMGGEGRHAEEWDLRTKRRVRADSGASFRIGDVLRHMRVAGIGTGS